MGGKVIKRKLVYGISVAIAPLEICASVEMFYC